MASNVIMVFMKSIFSLDFLRSVVSDFVGGVLSEVAEGAYKSAVASFGKNREIRALSTMQTVLDPLLRDKAFAEEFAKDLRNVTNAKGKALDMKIMFAFCMKRVKSFSAYVDEFPSCKSCTAEQKKAVVLLLEELNDVVLSNHFRVMNGEGCANIQTLLYVFEARLGG